MNTFELEIWDDESSLCTFYTVRNAANDDSARVSETEKFFVKYENEEMFAEAIEHLTDLLLVGIGERLGADDIFFSRFENEVAGLPPAGQIQVDEINYYFPQFPLRLYALKITDEIVILFNGGIKDGPTNQTSSLYSNWRAACRYAQIILSNLQDETIIVNDAERVLELYDGSKKIIL